MKKIKDIKIKTRLILGFGIVTLLIILVGWIGISGVNSVEHSATIILDQQVPVAEASMEMSIALMNAEALVQRYVVNGNMQELNDIETAFHITENTYDKYAGGILKGYHDGLISINPTKDPEVRKTVQKAKDYQRKFIDVAAKIMTAHKNYLSENDSPHAGEQKVLQALHTSQSLASKLKTLHEEVKHAADKSMSTAMIQANNVQKSSRSEILIFIVTGFLLSATIGFFSAQLIGKPLATLTNIANDLADGDISQSLDIDQGDEIGQLAHAFSQLMDSLSQKTELAKAIASGQLNHKVNIVSDRDTLGKALGSMRQTLEEKQEQTDKAKRDSDQKIAYLNNLDFPVHVVDKEMTVKFLNPKAAELAGKDIQSCMGEKCYDLFNNPHCNTEKCATARAIHEGQVQSAETIMQNGSTKLPIKYTGSPVRNEHGEIIGGMEQIFDITEMKNTIDEVSRVASELSAGQLGQRAHISVSNAELMNLVAIFNKAIDNIVAPISEAAICLDSIAKGDLTTSVTGDYQGDHKKIKDSLNATITTLNNILADLKQTAEQVASGSGQVSDTSQSISQGATEQASALEEISASITEISQQSAHNNENAVEAQKMVQLSRKNAEISSKQMGEMVDAMTTIDNSSNKISKIIKVIDEIAFQTNLLALNAAVEAARAGVHGKGFAVVAEEVRNLAQRSAKAAKETTDLIENSITQVKSGKNIVDKTVSKFQEIIADIKKVDTLVTEITAASGEQMEGIQQTTEALGQIDETTQASSAAAEQSAATAEELSSQAVQLSQIISKFKLKPSHEHSVHQLLHNAGIPGKTDAQTKRTPPAKEPTGNKPSSIALDDNDFGVF